MVSPSLPSANDVVYGWPLVGQNIFFICHTISTETLLRLMNELGTFFITFFQPSHLSIMFIKWVIRSYSIYELISRFIAGNTNIISSKINLMIHKQFIDYNHILQIFLVSKCSDYMVISSPRIFWQRDFLALKLLT